MADPQGLAFASVANEYERGRPGWPLAAIDRATATFGLEPHAEILDLAAGTGKLTRLLVSRFERVIAVEPLGSLRRVLEATTPSADSRAGGAESIPLPDDSVDAIFVAEAFHWFATEPVVDELARVLRPRGGLALLFNLPAADWRPPISGAAETVVEQAFRRGGPPGGPKVESGEWREPIESSPAFSELTTEHFDHELTLDRDGLIAHIISISSIARQPDGDRAQLAEALSVELLDVTYVRPFRTDLHCARLT